MKTFDRQVADLQIGKEKALSFFMDAYAQPLHFFAFKIVKDREAISEIVSDAFVKLWERRENFHAVESIKSFLYLVVKNGCLDHLRQHRHISHQDDALLDDLQDENQDILTKIIYTEVIALVVQEIEKLPTQQAKIFQLSFMEGKNTQEICEELGTTANMVYFARSKALATLQQVFKHKKLVFNQLSILWLINLHNNTL